MSGLTHVHNQHCANLVPSLAENNQVFKTVTLKLVVF